MKRIKQCCIIDDDPIFIYGTKRIMREIEFCDSLVVYNNGEDAINGIIESHAITKTLPEIIFLDLNMPIMNGWEFLDEFIKIPNASLNKTLIYIISSSVDPKDINRVKNYKLVSNYILKPITPNDLQKVLNTTLV